MRKEEYLKELLKWVSSDSLLVIDKKGALKRIYTPFQAICLVSFPNINQGEKVAVDAIKLTVEVMELFIFYGIPYYIIFFIIILV
jgi:hypothetical protein